MYNRRLKMDPCMSQIRSADEQPRSELSPGQHSSNSNPIVTVAKGYFAAAVIAVGWIWAITLLATRDHSVRTYTVLSPAPLLWGSIGLPAPCLLFAIAIGVAIAIACGHLVRAEKRFWTPPVCWLMVCWSIPGLDLLRLAGMSVPMTFLEPLLVAAATGAAVGKLADAFRATPQEHPRDPLLGWSAIVWLMAILCCGWWYYEGQRAYDNYFLGYNDFGHFGWRIANTWEGRGFLLETPSLPAFWDHFNPGLALLAPLWGIWPDPRLFILIQAICLAAPSLAVYGIARRLGARSAAAAAWAAAYLAFPTVGQLNLNASYGWHPVSLSLPLIFLAIWALLCNRRILACSAAILACSFQEDIAAILSFLALAMALHAWLNRRRPWALSSESLRLPADSLPVWAWLVVATVLGLAFVAMFQFTQFSRFQLGRFDDLGNSTSTILLSPILRPAVFWGLVLRPRCGYFLLCLTVPLGLRSVLRGWPMLLAAVLPLGVLLAWSHPPGTSIAFQYSTTLIPVLFLAAMTGAVMLGQGSPASTDVGQRENQSRALWRAGMTALAASATASLMIGALPWSSDTLTEVLLQTYAVNGDPQTIEDRLVGSPGNAVINQAVARARRQESTVLATGRIAAHLLAVRRLDTVGQACKRWKAFEEEVGSGRSAIELFDWVILDTNERFYQSSEELQFIIDGARRARYRLVQSDHGILVWARPTDVP
jgi:uncharacterized membrane protein